MRVLAEPHDRALAEIALDLRERGIKGLRFIHGRSFDDAKRCTHVLSSLWLGFGGHGSAARFPASPLAIGDGRSVHDMFFVRNMFSKVSWVLAPFHRHINGVALLNSGNESGL